MHRLNECIVNFRKIYSFTLKNRLFFVNLHKIAEADDTIDDRIW